MFLRVKQIAMGEVNQKQAFVVADEMQVGDEVFLRHVIIDVGFPFRIIGGDFPHRLLFV